MPVPASRSRLHDPVRSRTPRDRYLLHLLADHQVLTTTQIAQVWDAPLRRVQHRLTLLWSQHILDRFRPYTPYGTGSAPYHWTLGAGGATEVAAARDTTPAALGWSPRRTSDIAHSTQLAHRVAATGLFTALIAHTHTHPGTRLATWHSPAAFAARHPGGLRPDGYGDWHDHTATGHPVSVSFALEHDTGSETLDRLAGKLDRYARLAAGTNTPPMLLFRFLTPGREHAARTALAHHPALRTGAFGLATTVLPDPPDTDPAGPIWRLLPDPDPASGPVRLADLPGYSARPPTTVG